MSLLVLVLMSMTESTSIRLFIHWIIILLLFLIILPLVYVYLRIYGAGTGINLRNDPTVFLKRHPQDVLIVAFLFGLPGLVCLFFMEATPILLYTYSALFVGSLAIALCNLFYRVSYHLGTVTILAIMASIAWGQNYLILLAAIPLIGWAKYHIKEHTVTQLLSGIVIAVFIGGFVLVVR